MPYSDFTLTQLRQSFQLIQQRKLLFEQVPAVPPTPWLTETLRQGMELVIDTEKARSELLVMPILLTSRMIHHQQVSIYSGEMLNVAPEQGLNGECDFILTYSPPLAEMQSPIITLVEAKDHDIDSGLGQCAAQMMGARRFNQLDQLPIETIYGCVTTGEAWQFLKLEQNAIVIDAKRYYIDHVEHILGVLHLIIEFYRSLLAERPAAGPEKQ
jgi:hypothetical protein